MTVRIQHEDFNVASEIAALRQGGGDAGAIVTFTGLVRRDDGLTELRIEHYPGMTEREVEHHLQRATLRWPILDARVIHRVGTLKPGENIVLVGVASAHRQAAFEAAQFLMDYLKTRAPFWKEELRGQTRHWVEPRACDEAAATRWGSE